VIQRNIHYSTRLGNPILPSDEHLQTSPPLANTYRVVSPVALANPHPRLSPKPEYPVTKMPSAASRINQAGHGDELRTHW
jgi:hypothetical protein